MYTITAGDSPSTPVRIRTFFMARTQPMIRPALVASGPAAARHMACAAVLPGQESDRAAYAAAERFSNQQTMFPSALREEEDIRRLCIDEKSMSRGHTECPDT